VLALRPERLAVYNYAHLPHLFKVQQRIRAEDIPDAEAKLAILELTIRRLGEAGYVYIGMDHFALPDDELSVAQRRGSLHRNFQGYSTRAECDLVGLGVSSIGKVGDGFFQNRKEPEGYAQAIDEGGLAVFRGYLLNDDDRIRRDVISAIMCHSRVEMTAVEQEHNIDFRKYFADDLQRLEPLAEDGLVELQPRAVQVTPKGRMFLRNIGMAFDAYLDRGRASVSSGTPRYSRVL